MRIFLLLFQYFPPISRCNPQKSFLGTPHRAQVNYTLYQNVLDWIHRCYNCSAVAWQVPICCCWSQCWHSCSHHRVSHSLTCSLYCCTPNLRTQFQDSGSAFGFSSVTSTTWSKWLALTIWWVWLGKPNQPEFQEDWAEGRYITCLRRWLISKRCHCKINCQKMGITMLCLLMSPIIFWKTTRSWKLVYGFPYNMSQKLWKKKGKSSPFAVGSRHCWTRNVATVYTDSHLVPNSWGTMAAEVNLFGLLQCGKTLLPR